MYKGKKIKLSLKYHTNFTPNTNIYQNILKKKKKIYCKNIFFFFLIFEYLFKKKTPLKDQSTLKLFCLKKKKKPITLLRAPNRSKTAQINLVNTQYILLISFLFSGTTFSKIQASPTLLIKIFCFFIKNFNFFESNTLLLSSLKANIKYQYLIKF